VNPSLSLVLLQYSHFSTRHTIRVASCDSWDHFGGLLPLLLSIHNVQYWKDDVNEGEPRQQIQKSKRPRLLTGGVGPHARKHGAPLLLAPDRVLQYVALSLEYAEGYCIPISLQRRDFTAVVSGHLSALAKEASDARREGDDHAAPTAPSHRKRPMESRIAPASSLAVPTVLTLDKVRVDHCPHSYGFVLAIDRPAGDPKQSTTNTESYRPFLLCYSGDTRPCEGLVQACHFGSGRYSRRGIDLLLHEATFDDADRDQCDTKRHSTVSDAIGVSKRVNANRTLLTHFSQRYGSSSRSTRRDAPPPARIPTSVIRYRTPGDRAPPPRVMGATDGLLIKLF
jgi:ribonuclease BN (tRNA processing enzyme)